MNGTRIGTVCLLLASITPTKALAQSYWCPVSQADSIKLIRNLEGDQTLQPIMETPNYDMAAITPQGGTMRQFSCGIYKYSLECFSNDFVWRKDTRWMDNRKFYGMEDTASLAPSAISQASAQQIAQEFMLHQFPDPQKLTLMRTIPSKNLEPFVTSYDFFFCQDVGNGVRGPASCEVEVDTVYGRVVWYVGKDRPILAPVVPSITADQAAAAALAAFAPNGGGELSAVLAVGLTAPDAFGNETIAYSIVLSHPSVKVSVDGFTGQILDHIDLLSLSKSDPNAVERARKARLSPRVSLDTLLVATDGRKPDRYNRPPVRLAGQAYLPADFLRCGDRAAKVTWASDHKNYTLVTPRHQLTFTMGEKTYTLDGRKQTLKHSPAVVLDQPYVPLELAEKLMPYHLTYLAATKTVHFEPIAKKTASTAPSVVPVSTH